MVKYYVWLAVTVLIVAAGLPAASWLYANLQHWDAVIVDIVAIIIPFMYASYKTVKYSFEMHKAFQLINVVIAGLWAMTMFNLYGAFTYG